MPGRFEGLKDKEWDALKDKLPRPDKDKRPGRPCAPLRKILNSIMYIAITGCRWCDLPLEDKWAKKSTAHRYLKKWGESGILEEVLSCCVSEGDRKNLTNWEYGAVDGSFAAGKGGGEGVDYGGKGKGVLIHAMTEANGLPVAVIVTPASGGERAQVGPLLDKIKVKNGRPGRPRKRFKTLAADKGYDGKKLRAQIRERGIRPQIPKRQWPNKKHIGRPLEKKVPRYQQERTFAWLQRKYRRVVVRWERLSSCFNAFVFMGVIHIWITRILNGAPT